MPRSARCRVVSLAQWLRIVWIAGAIVFLIPVASVLWRLSMIRRTGLPVAWHRAELARLADARGVSLPVELLEHEAVPGPMTFGISRPVIVLPLDAREWSEAELRRALMHEIEHIQTRRLAYANRGSHGGGVVLVPPAGVDGVAAARASKRSGPVTMRS